MRIKKYLVFILILGIFIVVIQSCEKDNYMVPPPAKIGKATSSLEAQFVNTAPLTLLSPYWKSADYLKVNAVDVSKNYLFGDGLLNMTGIFGGKSDWGTDPSLTLKAAYDSSNIYILAEWMDNDVNLSEASWLWNGPGDAKKADSTLKWTSQRNNDKIALAFEIQTASNANGNFSNVGCAASCHVNGNNSTMQPDAGKVDIWNWSLARSAPLGYLRDMVSDPTSFNDDAGQVSSTRNSSGATNRSGPAYEWDGTTQTVTLANGQNTILDPGFYLVNKTPFIGDMVRGDSIYHAANSCAHCHGEFGEGAEAAFINGIALNKKSRASLISAMDNNADMAPYWGVLGGADRDNLVAFIRGLSGVPGYVLSKPTGSCADISSVNNVTPIHVVNAMLPKNNVHTKYQVLIIRKLKTNNTDDAQFDLSVSKTFKFGVAIMNNDSRNHIGSPVETLTFK
ncbi:MAG: ethylbenzene dehydrogenase-related protein [Bacteroidota bacterium]|nr:ethylbenzene dehydrogenase-related protein [Bacteroidota bacterium]